MEEKLPKNTAYDLEKWQAKDLIQDNHTVRIYESKANNEVLLSEFDKTLIKIVGSK